jgi:hypothetical protein
VGIDTALFSGKAGSRAAESQKFEFHGRKKEEGQGTGNGGEKEREGERTRRESCSPPTTAILGNAILVSILHKFDKEIKVSDRTSLSCLKVWEEGLQGPDINTAQ